MKFKNKIEKKLTITKKNIKELNEELKDLVHNRLKTVIKELKEARKQGDLSENSEYDAAKQKQGQIEERIAEIKNILKNSKVIYIKKTDVVVIGKKVKLLELKTNNHMEFRIGTIFDIDVNVNTISDVSPLAKALIGHKVGDQILVKCNEIQNSYYVKIISIE